MGVHKISQEAPINIENTCTHDSITGVTLNLFYKLYEIDTKK